MANEYDFMFNKSLDDWNRMIDVVVANDAHGIICCRSTTALRRSIITTSALTHVSIQRPYTERCTDWREEFGKPVSVDECRYEGDIGESWGNISGARAGPSVLAGHSVSGGYITHGETFYNDDEMLWWARGGQAGGRKRRAHRLS